MYHCRLLPCHFPNPGIGNEWGGGGGRQPRLANPVGSTPRGVQTPPIKYREPEKNNKTNNRFVRSLTTLTGAAARQYTTAFPIVV
jgi:hypothetical protein